MEDFSIQTSPLRICISRALEKAQAFCQAFGHLKSPPPELIGLPLIDTRQLPVVLEPDDLQDYQWILFTSAVAVHGVLSRFSSVPTHLKFAAVGPKTAQAIQGYIHRPPDFIPSEANSQALFGQFFKAGYKGDILWPCGNLADTRTHLLQKLPIHPLVVYKTIPAPWVSPDIKQALVKGVDFIALTSPSSVQAFHQHQLPHQQAKLVSIGPATSKAIQIILGRDPLESPNQTLESLAKTVLANSPSRRYC